MELQQPGLRLEVLLIVIPLIATTTKCHLSTHSVEAGEQFQLKRCNSLQCQYCGLCVCS